MMEQQAKRVEAERLLGIADKLLQGRDLSGSRDFAILAQETEPLLDGSDQILAVADVLLAADRRINNHHDWYSILQVDRRSDEVDLIKRQYRRLALLLHPDKNKFAFADSAFKLVADAWAVLSDPAKKSLYDNELSLFTKVDLVAMKHQKGNQQFRQSERDNQDQVQRKLPVRRGHTAAAANSGGAKRRSEDAKLSSFWTACPYCYNLYEYPRVYEGCCLRCQNCQRAFHAAQIPSLPPLVPGKEAYSCCWGFFPLGFSEGGKSAGFPNWMPPMFQAAGNTSEPAAAAQPPNGGAVDGAGFVDISGGNVTPAEPVARKRGRPRKNV
ncbi:uncharacterized protein LOC132278641 [Cornus florida]|uniref:uncharacterized protein LOC132278641 n=1 Tax=Cornus florida TaxID=4283 RepID=UPI00289E5C0C|nr:uncharacterized protein LOC132278641 [Cornus florida]